MLHVIGTDLLFLKKSNREVIREACKRKNKVDMSEMTNDGETNLDMINNFESRMYGPLNLLLANVPTLKQIMVESRIMAKLRGPYILLSK